MSTPTLREAAHEIWAAAQLTPGEGIEDGVARIEALLSQGADAGAAEPVGWLYTLHMEFGQTQVKFSADRFDLAVTTPWGRPGRDYSAEYPVTESPAHTAQQLQQAVARALAPIQQAIRDYHYALDTRQHGGVAAGKAVDAISEALGMHWKQGEEAAIRQQGTP